MSTARPPQPNEIEELLRNAQLRDELEPFFDESIERLNAHELTTPAENDLLASMLAWERAPVLAISQWFTPELKLPRPESLDHHQLHEELWHTVQQLFEKRIVLDFTDHLTDRQLYTLIYRDILPSQEKKIDHLNNYLHWDCSDAGGREDIWLRYYATDEDRMLWFDETHGELPERELPPYPRRLPREQNH
ncbi:MAG: hypothetical protein SGJ20_16675 [Planctomycetota bacterium]|nr:hypothetical protein [Planctomycetota bacterium]